MRALCVALSLLLIGGCASSSGSSTPNRTAPAVILGVLLAGSAALAVTAAVKSKDLGRKLDDDVKGGSLDGTTFIERDKEGRRWNRIGRASAFVGGLAALGLAIVWEMGLGQHADEQVPSPSPVAGGPRAATPTSWLPAPSSRQVAARSVLFSGPRD